MSAVDDLKQAGFSNDEVTSWMADKSQQLTNAGFGQDEIQSYFGNKTPDDNAIRKTFQSNIQKHADSTQKPLSIIDAIEAGLQMSTAGLALRGKMPDKYITQQDPFYNRIAANTAQMIGDVPAMLAGAALGGAEGGADGVIAGSPTGPGAVVTGVTGAGIGAIAGAFALPVGLRATMIDAYQKGEFKTFPDFFSRASGILLDTAKSWVTGAATGTVGGATGAALEATAPIIKSTGQLASEIATMTTVGKGLEGQVPNLQDFTDAAVVLFGVKMATHGASKLMDIYKQTGNTPAQIIQDAKTDPTIIQDLAGTNTAIPKAYENQIDPMFKPEETAKADRLTISKGDEATAAADDAVAAQKQAEFDKSQQTADVSMNTNGTLTARQTIMPEPVKETPPATPEEPPEKGSVEESQKAILDKVQLDIGDKTDKPLNLYARLIDYKDPIKVAVEAMQEDKDPVAAYQDAYKQMRMAPASQDIAKHFTDFGTLDFKTREINGESLSNILEPLKDDVEKTDRFRAYLIAARNKEVVENGLKTPFDFNQTEQVRKAYSPEFQEMGQRLVDYQTRGVQYLRDSGVLSDEAYKAMTEKWAAYVPWNRVMDTDQSSLGIGTNVKNPIKRMMGSERDLQDPLANVIKNTYAYVSIAEKNDAALNFYKLADKSSDPSLFFEKVSPDFKRTTVNDAEMGKFLKNEGIEQIPEEALSVFRAMRQPLAKDEIGFFDEGKWTVLKVDPEVANAFKVTPSSQANLLMDMVRFPAMLFRAGLTTPEFIIRHLIRNQISSTSLGDVEMRPFYDTFKGLVSYLKEDENYQEWLKSGAPKGFAGSIDRDFMADELHRLIEQHPETNFLDKAWNIAKTPLDILHATQSGLENATGVGAYMRAIGDQEPTKENLVDAGWRSRNISPDFSRIGSDTATWNAITALFNVEIQHTDQLVNALRERPVGTLAKIFATVTLPSIAVWTAFHNTPAYQEAQPWEKDQFWIIPWGDHTFRIPKPFFLGVVFGSSAEHLLDGLYSGNDKRSNEMLAHSMLETAIPHVIPNAAMPVLEQITNHSFFRGEPLVPDHLMKMLPEYRYSEYTLPLTQQLGHILGTVPFVQDSNTASPIVIGNYIRQWTGGMGMYALQIADAGLRHAGVLPDPVMPSSTLADIPIVKAFISRYPSASAESIQRFRDDYQDLSMRYNTFQQLAKQGNVDAAIKVMQANPVAMMKLDGIEKMLSQQTQLIRMIVRNPEITGDEKRQLIDSTYYQMIQVTQMGNMAMKNIRKSFEENKQLGVQP